MGDYIGIRNLCQLCIYGEIKNKDKHGKLDPEKVVCQNKESNFHNIATAGILCAPCFIQKKLKEGTKIEYVGFGD